MSPHRFRRVKEEHVSFPLYHRHTAANENPHTHDHAYHPRQGPKLAELVTANIDIKKDVDDARKEVRSNKAIHNLWIELRHIPGEDCSHEQREVLKPVLGGPFSSLIATVDLGWR